MILTMSQRRNAFLIYMICTRLKFHHPEPTNKNATEQMNATIVWSMNTTKIIIHPFGKPSEPLWESFPTPFPNTYMI